MRVTGIRLATDHILINYRIPSLIPAFFFFLTSRPLKTGTARSFAVTVIAALPPDKDTSTFNTSHPRDPSAASTNTSKLTEMEGHMARFALLLCITVAASGKSASWYSIFSGFRSFVTWFPAKKCILSVDSRPQGAFPNPSKADINLVLSSVLRSFHSQDIKEYYVLCFYFSCTLNQDFTTGLWREVTCKIAVVKSFGSNGGLSLQQIKHHTSCNILIE